MANDNSFTIDLKKFYAGFSPLAFQNSLTELGGGGHASLMTNVDVVNGSYLTQGQGLSNLTNGTQSGAVTELINFIQDKAVANDTAYAVGTTKLFQLSSTTVTSNGTFPHAISACTSGTSVIDLKGNLYYFYNKASGGDIGKYDLSSTFTDNWGSTVPTGKAALQNAPHPVGAKEDIMLFGNGQYVGTFLNDTTTLAPTKLDFGSGNQVADVLYNAGYWYIAVNSGVTGTNRTEGSIFLYDGSAIPTTLADEAGVGVQRIGFLYRINGVVYLAYTDLSSSGFIIGYINGKSITPLVRFTGTLPNYQQKTLYKNTILFLSSNLVYCAGAFIPELPYQLSQIASTSYSTVGAIAAPFGTPLVSSTDGGSNFALAKFSGFTTNASWKSIVFPVTQGLRLGYIDSITVITKSLGANASCSMTLECNQNSLTSTAQTIQTTSKTRHHFTNFGLSGIQDFRVAFDWSGGSTTNDAAIRNVFVKGHWVEE